MRLPGWLIAIGLIAGVALCMRLGFWQLARMHAKRALHAMQSELLAEAPVEVSASLPAAAPATGHRVTLSGAWDGSAHVLLSGRTHLGAAGVSLVSALRLTSGEAVLVERGWLAAADSRSAHPERLALGDARVTGVTLSLARAPGSPRWDLLGDSRGGAALWSARVLDADSAAARFKGPLATWMVRALPDPKPPNPVAGEVAPIATPYEVNDGGMHLSYAIQWFAFAAVLAGGSLALALRRRAAPHG